MTSPDHLPAGIGVVPLEEGARIDVDRMRRDRWARLLRAMADADVDALLLGREQTVRFAIGARRLWTGGTRPYAPATVIVRDGEAVHLMTTYDEGIPAEIPRDHMYALTWNPMTIAGQVASIPGADRWRRVGVDGMTPLFATLLAATLPGLEYVDAIPIFRDARESKTPDEIAATRLSAAIADAAVSAAVSALTPGVSTGALEGLMERRRCEFGTPAPAICPQAVILGDDDADTSRPVHPGDRVYLEASAQYAGYVASCGRTVECTASGVPVIVLPDSPPAREELLRTLTRGASPASIRAAATASASQLVATVGLGFEDVLFDATVDDGSSIPSCEAATLYLRADSHDGRIRWADTVLVTVQGTEALTTLGAPNG